MRMRGLLLGGLPLLFAGAWLAWAQGAFDPTTSIPVFENGFRLGAERLNGMSRSAATGITLGGTDVATVTVTTSAAQDSTLVLPANSVGGSELSGMRMDLVFCGQADEAGTIYLSPTAGVNGVDFGDGVDYSISGTACDGLDGATETTQDLIVFPEVAFKVAGMYCQQAGAEALGSGETMVFTFRAGAADTTPAITCTISEAQRGCRSLTGTTTNVAANTAVAMRLVQTGNNTDQDAWCSVSIMLQ